MSQVTKRYRVWCLPRFRETKAAKITRIKTIFFNPEVNLLYKFDFDICMICLVQLQSVDGLDQNCLARVILHILSGIS